MKSLLVVTEVDYISEQNFTRNRSLNKILEEYKKYFESIHVVCPSDEFVTCKESEHKGIYFSTFTNYKKPISNRINFLLNSRDTKRRMQYILEMVKPDIIQFRIPSIFVLSIYRTVSNCNATFTSYIAGNWKESFAANYDFIGSKFVGAILDKAQHSIIRNSIPVSAGSVLAEKYKHLNDVYAYFSTTHEGICISKKNVSKLTFLYVGRLENLKRIDDALIALDKLNKQSIPFEFNILGEGCEEDRLKQLCKDLELEENVHFRGYISDLKELESYYSSADIFLFPSISEGTPKVLPEAMSYGVIPIAVATTGSISSIIKDNVNGMLVDKMSPLQIWNKIKYVNDNRNELDRIKQACYKYAEEHTLGNEVKKLWSHIYEKL